MSDPGDPDGPSVPPVRDDDRTRIAGGDEGAPRAVPRPGTGGAPTIPLGTRINNNYEIIAVLKAGGMGEVYRGENVFTHDQVAIKLVKPDLAGDEKVALMFRREARTLGQLFDDAIVRYYNFVHDTAIDRYCLIMEFIEGTPLSERMETRGAITESEARGLMRRLATGLAKAHGMEVIHRDLSPDNVMLPGGSIAGAKLIDFGIARSPLLAEGTMAGQFAGKFKFVAPEQLGHFDGVIGPATDIYGLGLLIAAAVRGTALPMGGSVVEAVMARREVPDLSDVPEGLRGLLTRMLQPDPAHRPADMGAVLGLLDGAPVPPLAAAPFVPPVTASGLRLPPGAGGFDRAVVPEPAPRAAPVERERGAGGKILGGLVLLFALLMGGVGWYAWQEGLVGGARDVVETPPEIVDPDGPDVVAPEIAPDPPAFTGSRSELLAEFGGSCAVALRHGSGPMAGLVEGYGRPATDWSGLPDAFEAAFGARPEVVPRAVEPPQCPALDFARPFLAADPVAPVELILDADTLTSGAALTGRLEDGLARPVWLALVTPDGAVFNASDRLSAPVGDRRALRVGLALPPGGAAAGQVLLAIATNRPLASAASAVPGTQAADLLPLIAAEIERRGEDVAVTLGHVTLTPDVSEPDAPSGN